MKAAQWLAGVAFAGLAAVAAALVSQYQFGIQPCPWCVLQRAIYVAIALACLLGLVWRSALGRRVGAGLGLLLALGGAAAALWQQFVAAASASCNLTLADKIVSRWLHLDTALPNVFEARASCADAAVNLLGVPYDVWSLALFTLMALALWRALSTTGRS